MSLRQTPKRNFMPGSLFYYIYRLKALFKKILRYKCFPVNFVKFLNHLFYRTLADRCFWKSTAKTLCLRILLNLFSCFLWIHSKFRSIYRKTPVLRSLFKQETLAQVLSCEFCETFKEPFVKPLLDPSVLIWKIIAIRNRKIEKRKKLKMEK